RSAPMAVAFAGRAALGGRFDGDAVVAMHGSWGTQPDGSSSGDPATRRPPRLALVRFVDGKAVRVDDFVRGFQLEDGRRWARPVGAAFGPDGALYFTSDGGINGLFRLVADVVR
ncbi:MAG: sugar dehydrogenase, partial [Verrucomicrobia bacterium]|nr:sugar dehydrogenase [Verrucomicrobiota bacterium]